MASSSERGAAKKPPGYREASGGDRGDAGSSNIEQSRQIGQDDPTEGSRMGKEADKSSGFPGDPDNEAEDQSGAAREDAIRQAAYEAYLHRGSSSGSELDDWLEAERAVDARGKEGSPPEGA